MNRLQIIFEAVGDGPPTAVRIRRLLKGALRHYGLRCVAISDPEGTTRHPEPLKRARGAGHALPSQPLPTASNGFPDR